MSIYSYFEGPHAIFRDSDHYDHFLESLIESILKLMVNLSLTFSKNILSHNFTFQQTYMETDAKTNLDTERLGDNLLDSNRNYNSVEESKDSPLHRSTQIDLQK